MFDKETETYLKKYFKVIKTKAIFVGTTDVYFESIDWQNPYKILKVYPVAIDIECNEEMLKYFVDRWWIHGTEFEKYFRIIEE